MNPADKNTTTALPQTVEGIFPLEYLYTAGIAGERVLRALKDHGTLLGSRCPACEVTYVPGRLYCERCLSPLEEWLEIPLEGTLASYTVVHRDLDGNPLSPPAILGLIELDGVGGTFVHWVGNSEPDKLAIGQRVCAEMRPKADRRGSITDIAFFRPST